MRERWRALQRCLCNGCVGRRRDGWRCEGGSGERRARVRSTPPASASLDCSARTGHPVTAGMDAVCARSAQWRGQRRRAERGGMRNTLPSSNPSISLSPSLLFSSLFAASDAVDDTAEHTGQARWMTAGDSVEFDRAELCPLRRQVDGRRLMRVAEVCGERGNTLAASRGRLEQRMFTRTWMRRRRRVEWRHCVMISEDIE